MQHGQISQIITTPKEVSRKYMEGANQVLTFPMSFGGTKAHGSRDYCGFSRVYNFTTFLYLWSKFCERTAKARGTEAQLERTSDSDCFHFTLQACQASEWLGFWASKQLQHWIQSPLRATIRVSECFGDHAGNAVSKRGRHERGHAQMRLMLSARPDNQRQLIFNLHVDGSGLGNGSGAKGRMCFWGQLLVPFQVK